MRTAFLSLAVAILLAACGYKAPLYLPQPKPAPAAQKPATPATASTPAASPTPAAAADPAAPQQNDATK